MQGQEQLVQNMMTMMARMMNHENRENNGPRREDRNFKVDVESFDGTLDPEKYQEWEQSLERYFEYNNVEEEERKYKVAKVKLSMYAETWLKGFQKKRDAKDKDRISTWSKL